MNESIVLKIPSDTLYMKIVKNVIKDSCETLPLTQEDIADLLSSVKELIHNAITHAYRGKRGYIEISMHPFKTGMRIDVHDWGRPMSYKKHVSVPIDKEASAGFNRIYDLMDIFEYHNLGKEGKKFVIIKYASHPIHTPKNLKAPSSTSITETTDNIDPNMPILIREFKEGDEEGIAHLIYQNYGHSYVNDFFYYPQKILEFHSKKFYSVVAETNHEIIGHFAFILVPESTIAEIGIVVVDPLFQGKGIMNRMLKLILEKAKEIGLDAVFGQALMYHTYSQKSNLRHHFAETAIMLGKTPASITIEDNELTKKQKRGSVLVGYRFFNKKTKALYLPKVYEDQIKISYLNAEISFIENKRKEKKERKKMPKHLFLNYHFSPTSNIAIIRVDCYAKDFKQKFQQLLTQLRAKHCDMIYADVSLEKIPEINKVIKIINKKGFFYSGVMFYYHEKKDYLRLQLKHSDKIGSENYVCYSDFCKNLSSYILKDEKRVTL